MMKAVTKFDKELNKWVINITTEDEEIIPVGKTINEEINLWEISTWDTKKQAIDWINNSPKLTLADEK